MTGFSIASVTVNGLDYHGGGTRIWSNGTSSMTGITLDAKGTFTSFKDKNGFDDRRLSGIIINTMKIKNISADRIGYSSRDAGISAEVLSGGLEDIDVTGMVIELPPEPGAKPKVTGKVGVHGIDHLRLNAVIGRELTLRGTLTGSDIKVALLNGGERVHVGDLSLDKGEILGGKNGLSRITVTHLSGDVSRQDTATGDVVELRNINLAVARLEAGANWSGGGTALRFDGGAEIRKLSVDAKITRRRDGKKMVIQQVEIPLLHVDSITADAVTIHTDAVAYDPESGTDPAPAKTLSLVHAKITDLNVEGFDLAKRLGTLRVGREDINDLGLVIAERGNDAFKEAHLNLHGTGLTGTVTGAPNPPDTVTPSGTAGSKEGSPGARGAVAGTPAQGEPLSSSLNTLLPGLGSNIVTVNLGHIERISGSYQDAKTKVVSASATDIGGTAEIGPDYVQLRDIEVGAMHLGTTTYSDRPGNQIRLSGANATGVRLSSLRADFSSTKKEGDLSLSRISLRGLHFGRIVADNFLYTGMSESEDKTGQKVVSQSQVKAGRAVVAPLDVEELDHSMLSDVTHIKADIGQVSLHRFVGDFNTQVAGKLSSAVHFATDLTAGGLKADMFLEPGVGPDGERTTDVQGTFHLDRLGLRHTSLVYAGFKGGKPDVAVTVALDKAAKAGINIKGLDVGLSPDGGLQLRLDDVIARHLKVNAKIGDKTISVELPFGRIRAIALGLEGKKVPEAMQRLALTTGDIVTSGLHVTAHLVRSAPPKGGVAPKGDLILEPLGGANGVLRLTNEIGYGEKDTDWLELAVENGMIDLDHSLLFPTAPDARLPGEESLEKLNKWLSKVITGDSDLTKIDLRKLVEGKLNDPGGPSTGKPTDLSILNYLGLRQSKVTLGAGRIGTPKYGINLVAGVPAINLFEILPSVIGKQLDITTKLLAGTSFDFATSDTDAQGNETVTKGQTGIVAFTKVRISIIGLGSEAEFDVDLRTEGGFVRGVTFGDVSLITKELIPDPDAGKTPAAGGGP